MIWLVALKETFKNNLPFSQCSPVKPEGHKHRYFFSVNPDWQVPLLWQRGLLQALFKKNKNQVWFVTEVTPNLHDRASTINYKMKMTMMVIWYIGSLNNDNFARGLSLILYFVGVVSWPDWFHVSRQRFLSFFLFFNLDTVL